MPPRPFAVLMLALLAACCGFVLLGGGDRGSYDFQAFYCAGKTLAMHADPYRAQPLGTCEHTQTDGTYAALARGVVLPAPQPAYDIVAFSVLSRLPFAFAKAVWGALLALAIASAIYGLVRVTALPLATIVMAFAASLILPSLAFGELVALFAAASAMAMVYAQRGQWNAAGIAAVASLVEPHLGVPVCVCLAVWQPRARVAMLISAAVLGAVSLAVLGERANIEYFTTVLPLHALSELSSDAQLGLSGLLHGLGFTDSFALGAGTTSYVLLGACAVLIAKRLGERFGDDAFLIAVPAAFATIGGTFMHVTQIFAAVPLLLLLLARAPEHRTVLLCVAVLLCVPWIAGIERGNALAFALLAAMVVAAIVWEPHRARIAIAVGAAGVTFVLLLAAPEWYAHAAAAVHAPVDTAAIDPVYAQAGWRKWNAATLSSGSAPAWVLRGATWLGLLVLASRAAALSRRPAASFAAAARSTPPVR